MQDSLFRMYDMRGKVGSELIIQETYDLIKAVCYYFVSKNPAVKTIAIGMDGRTHSPEIKAQVCRAVQDSGLNVVFIGLCPSPLLYFSLHVLKVDAGIMITASHNPKEYNGFKLCLGKISLAGDEIQQIKKMYRNHMALPSSNRGTYVVHEIVPDYLEYIAQLFPHLTNMPLPVIFDCGNGAMGAVIPGLVEKMGWKNAQLLCVQVDGNYPNHEADPVVEENMQDVKRALATGPATVGIGFDGDGDRMAAMTKQGYLVPGDQMLALLSAEYLKKIPGGAVVCDIKSSSVLLEVVKARGGQAYLSPSGHSLVKGTMKKHNAQLGGELSGHFFFYDRYLGFDDGIYAALRLLELLLETGIGLDELVAQLPHKVSSIEYRVACDEEKKLMIVQKVQETFALLSDADLVTIDGIRLTWCGALGVLRASNTQPVLSMRFEADTQEKLQEIKELFAKALDPYMDGEALRTQIMSSDKGIG